MWFFEGTEFKEEDAQKFIDNGAVGFVYEIHDLKTDMKYIGKKNLIRKIRRSPLKGKKRKRVEVHQSDWQKYYGSNELLKEAVSIDGSERFKRYILHICYSKGEMSYIEAKLQFMNDVLLRNDYYNEFIGCKIHSSHVSHLKNNSD